MTTSGPSASSVRTSIRKLRHRFCDRSFLWQMIRFWAFGQPMLIVGLALNLLLVRALHWEKPGAYLLVLFVQTGVNFALCNWVVFRTDGRFRWPRLAGFASLILLFRGLEWSLYTLIVSTTPLPFLAVQISVIAIIAFPKFLAFRYNFEGLKTHGDALSRPVTSESASNPRG